jgi:hypothetical protein
VIAVEEAESLWLRPAGSAGPLTARRRKYTWRPPETLQAQLPPGFELPLQCVVDPEGLRRFYPWSSFEGFLALAWAGGLAILCHRYQLDAPQRQSYRAMPFLFLRARRRAEFFRRQFDDPQDLSVAKSGRTDPTERDILPEDVGLDALGNGQRWDRGELIRRGGEAARAAGYDRPTTAQCIHYGLVEAARRNPLPIAEDRVPLLIRSALFKIDPADEPEAGLVEVVTERLLAAVDPHLDDETAAFEKWFLGSNNRLAHQLAKQKRSRGGELAEDDVRDVLLHLGWRAYQYAAQCIHAQMRFFRNALPDPLSEREACWFEHMHQPQPYLGNLPLVLLLQRFRFLRAPLWELWEGLPDLRPVPVLHRLLFYYADMVARRREADRRIKNGRPAPLIETPAGPSPQGDLFQDIAAAVREIRHIDCHCPRREWHAELAGPAGAEVRIRHRCMACDYQAESTLTRDEFAAIGWSFQ